MRFCPNCGNPLGGSPRYCAGCATQVGAENGTASAAAPGDPPPGDAGLGRPPPIPGTSAALARQRSVLGGQSPALARQQPALGGQSPALACRRRALGGDPRPGR